jgi:two-component system, OmpR family, phosphate regulon sensor histidine kinase PhoR
VRRGVFILILCSALLAGGAAALTVMPARDLKTRVGSIKSNRLAALVLFMLAGVSGAGGMFAMRRACTRLTADLRRMAHDGPSGRLRSPHPDLDALVEAFNAVVETTNQTVGEAKLKVKELDIRLRVATAEREQAEAIIYSISDAVLVTDQFDELVLANDSAARTFRFDLERSDRAPINKLLQDERMISLIREMRQAAGRAGRRILEHRLKTSEGDRVFKVTLSNMAAGENEVAPGVVAVLHDMTREKEVGEMKNDFVSHVSHELRTPLASIKAYVEMLIDGEAEDQRTRDEFYEVIQNEANRLSRLIDNILNISRIESGLVKVNKKPLSLSVVLKEAAEVIAPQCKQKGIALVERISPAVYQTLADRDMLYESVLNLLSNAVKYTQTGGTVTVETVADESKRTITARVSDTGVGIPPKDLPYVFDKFFRVDANNKMAKGTGLGLSLVKHVVENVHQGRIFVESVVGKGSTFGFELALSE